MPIKRRLFLHMFLDKYVREVDEQLARLIAARDKIALLAWPAPDFKTEFRYEADLPRAAVAEEPQAESTEVVPEPVERKAAEAVKTPEIVVTPAKRRGRPKGSRNKNIMIRTRRTAAPESRALTNTVPTGPVVVSPAQLAQRQVVVVAKPQAPAPKPEASGGGLDALIRELSERRATAFSPAA